MGSPKWIDSLDGKEEPAFLEKHYTVKKLAEAWNMPAERVRRMFEEEDVLKYGTGRLTKKSKRAYMSLRIPESVVRRVYERYRRAGTVKEIPVVAQEALESGVAESEAPPETDNR